MLCSFTIQEFGPKYFKAYKIFEGKKKIFRNPKTELRYNGTQYCYKNIISRVMNESNLRLKITRVLGG